MKWSITQLRKYQGKPFEFNQTANFEHLIEPLKRLIYQKSMLKVN